MRPRRLPHSLAWACVGIILLMATGCGDGGSPSPDATSQATSSDAIPPDVQCPTGAEYAAATGVRDEPVVTSRRDPIAEQVVCRVEFSTPERPRFVYLTVIPDPGDTLGAHV